MNEIVSLIAPFYNAEKYLERCIKSVLNQTYKKIQFILVNDGSTDESDTIVQKYRSELEEKLGEFLYLEQSNGGAASAVNNAIKYVKGKYLCWMDCDDELLPENVELKKLFLDNHPDCGLVNCAAEGISQEEPEFGWGGAIQHLAIPETDRKDNMFMQIIDGIPVYSGVFMIRTKLLFDRLNNREIPYNPEVGQNWQLLLPVAYDNKCGFMDEVLYRYYIRTDSHSRDVDYQKAYMRTYVREQLLNEITVFMKPVERKKLLDKIHTEECHKRFALSFSNEDTNGNNQAYTELKKEGIVSKKEIIKHQLINHKFLFTIYQKIKRKA